MENREPRIGLVQKGTENEQVGREMLEGLLERGVNIDEGLLCVIDGSKGERISVRRRLQEVYEESTYEKAKGKLLKERKELQQINRPAVNSLHEGFEETSTLHPLGLLQELGTASKRPTVWNR